MKFPTEEEFAKNVAEKALDEYEYNGKTLREWAEIISAIPVTAIPATDINVGTKVGTNLAEVGTDRAVKGFPIDADDLMLRVEEKYGFRSRDRLYDIIRKMPKYELPPIQPEQTNCDYCHEDVDGYVKPIEKNGHAFVCFGMNGWELELKAKGWHGEAKIQYCPMCGRKLKNDK